MPWASQIICIIYNYCATDPSMHTRIRKQLIRWLAVFSPCLFVTVEAATQTSSLGNDTVSHLWQENDTCSEVHDVPSPLKCKFVRNVTDCQPDGGLINYFVFTHCWMPNNLIPLSAIIMVSR